MKHLKKSKIDPRYVIEKFEEGELLARAHYSNVEVTNKKKIDINVSAFLGEMEGIVDTSKDDKRHGNRSASTSLLIPNLNLGLFHDVAFLHDIDQCTVRAYMFKDSVTVSKAADPEYHNINLDKKKFEPIISKKEFIEKYKKYYNEEQNRTEYNEIVANIFPNSLLGITISDKAFNLNASKLSALAAQFKIKNEYGIELPLFLYQKGKMVEFKPTKEEILSILNTVFQNKRAKLEVSEAALKGEYLKLLSQLGYETPTPGLVNLLDSSNLDKLVLWKKDIDLEEIDFFKKTCNQFINALRTEAKRFSELKDDKAVNRINKSIKEMESLLNSSIKSNNDMRHNYKLFSQKIVDLSKEPIFKPGKFKQLINSIYKAVMQKLGYINPKPLFSTRIDKVTHSFSNSLKPRHHKKEVSVKSDLAKNVKNSKQR